jgi:CheY-like chemotaxis protein
LELNKILCIDDDPDILAIVQISLEALGGYALHTCLTGDEGIQMAEAWQPDLVLTDVMMPELDGIATFKLLNGLRGAVATGAIPFARGSGINSKTVRPDAAAG